jgi:outer membrane protein
MRTLARLGISLLPSLIMIAPLTAQTTAAENAPPPRGTPFVYVNTQAILPEAPGAQEAQDAFNQELEAFNTEVQNLRAEVDSLLAQYQQQEAMLSPEARQQRQQDILAKQQEAQTRAGELEQQAGRRQQELLQPILDRVGAIIEQLRAENEYAVVFDVANTGVVAADPALDITRIVIARLSAAGTAQNPGR